MIQRRFFYVFRYIALYKQMTPTGMASFDPRGLIGRIYVRDLIKYFILNKWINIWVLWLFQEYCNYIEPIINQRQVKTGVPGEKPPDLPCWTWHFTCVPSEAPTIHTKYAHGFREDFWHFFQYMALNKKNNTSWVWSALNGRIYVGELLSLLHTK